MPPAAILRCSRGKSALTQFESRKPLLLAHYPEQREAHVLTQFHELLQTFFVQRADAAAAVLLGSCRHVTSTCLRCNSVRQGESRRPHTHTGAPASALSCPSAAVMSCILLRVVWVHAHSA